MDKTVHKKTMLTAASVSAIVLTLVATNMGTVTPEQRDVLAQDKSTSITCNGDGPCEKTECVNGDCETITTNSSNVSSTTGSDSKDSDEEKSVVTDSLRERLSMREN